MRRNRLIPPPERWMISGLSSLCVSFSDLLWMPSQYLPLRHPGHSGRRVIGKVTCMPFTIRLLAAGAAGLVLAGAAVVPATAASAKAVTYDRTTATEARRVDAVKT